MIEQLYYSVDELACLVSGFENELNEKLDEIIPFDDNQDLRLAKRNKMLIIQHIRANKLELPEYFHEVRGYDLGEAWSDFDSFLSRIDSKHNYSGTEQVIPTNNIRAWACKYEYKLWGDPLTVKGETPITDINENAPFLKEAIDSSDIEKLLNGTHDHQSIELQAALKGWLYQIKQADQKKPKSSIRAFLDQSFPDGVLSVSAKDRIAMVANWNKDGNR